MRMQDLRKALETEFGLIPPHRILYLATNGHIDPPKKNSYGHYVFEDRHVTQVGEYLRKPRYLPPKG